MSKNTTKEKVDDVEKSKQPDAADKKPKTKSSKIEDIFIGLNSRQAMWNTNSNSIVLNKFNGNISFKYNESKLSKKDIIEINDGLRLGTLTYYNEEINTEPYSKDTTISDSERYKIYKFLDIKKIDQFKKSIDKQTNVLFLNNMSYVEKHDKDRKEYITIIKERLANLIN